MMEMNKTGIHLQRFNETLDQWIASLDDYTITMLHQKPADDSWSLGQVFVHIIDDTNYFIDEIKLALATTDNSHEQMHDNAIAILNNDGFPDIRIANPSASQPPQPGDKNELLEGLTSIKDEMNKLCLANDLEKSVGKTRHPGLLYFSALEWLRFAEIHIRHHFRQKKRIDDALFTAKK
jgi:hypothetical protein